MFNFPARLECENIIYLCLAIFVLVAKNTTSYKIGGYCKNEGETRALSIGNRYLKCENGNFILRACTAGKSFDYIKKECVVPFLPQSRGSKSKSASSDILSTVTLPTQDPSSSSTTFISGSTSENTPSGISSTFTLPTLDPSSSSTTLTSGFTSESTSSYVPSTETSTTQEPFSEVTPTERVTTEISSTWTSSRYSTTNEPTSEVPTVASTNLATITTSTGNTASIPTTTITPSSTTTTASPTTTTKESSTTATTSTTSTTKPPIPECKTEGQKRIFKKGDCKDYLECDSGKWVKKSCSWGWDFDIYKLECVFSWWAKC